MQYVDLHEVEGCWVVVVNLLKCLRPSPASLSGGTEREEAERRVRGGGARREREEGGGGGGARKEREKRKEAGRCQNLRYVYNWKTILSMPSKQLCDLTFMLKGFIARALLQSLMAFLGWLVWR